MNKITILGIGDEGPAGLTAHCREKLAAGELLVAAPGILKQVPDFQGETIALRDDLQEIVLAIKNNRDKNIVVLSNGGIGLLFSVPKVAFKIRFYR